MAITRCVLGIDIGTSGLKIVALSQEGQVCADSCVAYGAKTHYGQVGMAAEQDPYTWLNAVDQAMGHLPLTWRNHVVLKLAKLAPENLPAIPAGRRNRRSD